MQDFLQRFFAPPDYLQGNHLANLLRVWLVALACSALINVYHERYFLLAPLSLVIIGMGAALFVGIDRRMHWSFHASYAVFPVLAIFVMTRYRMDLAYMWSFAVVIFIYIFTNLHSARLFNIVLVLMLGFVGWQQVEDMYLSRFILCHFIVGSSLNFFLVTLKSQAVQLQVLTVTDELTKLPNRRKAGEKLEEYLSMKSRQPDSIYGLAILDIDYFKQVNDQYGHDAGDKVLSQFGELLQARTRKSDFVARYGGEEFLLVFPDTSQEGALKLLESLRVLVEKNSFHHGEKLSFSAGISWLQSSESIESWLKRSDQALYEAKKHGRNCIVVDDSDEQDEQLSPRTVA